MSGDFLDRFRRALLISIDESPDVEMPEGFSEWTEKLRFYLQEEGIEILDNKELWQCPACNAEVEEDLRVQVCRRCAG